MPALLTIVSEEDVRRCAEGKLSPEEEDAVYEAIRTDSRALGLFEHIKKARQTEKEVRMTIEKKPTEARQAVSFGAGRRMLVAGIATVAVIAIAILIADQEALTTVANSLTGLFAA
ncbi:MAG: hypothetical protein RLO08_04450 [Parvibaculaceae bacterium]